MIRAFHKWSLVAVFLLMILNIAGISIADAFDASSTSFFIRQNVLPLGAMPGSKPLGSLSSGLVGWWKLDEPSGTVVVDSSGSGNAGTLTGYATRVPGKVNDGVQLDGSSGYVTLGSKSLGYTNVTISSWIKYNGQNGAGFEGIMSKNCYVDFIMAVEGNVNPARAVVYMQNTVGAFSGNVFSTAYVDDGKWHMLTGTGDGTNVNLYVDGAYQGQLALSGSINDANAETDFGVYSPQSVTNCNPTNHINYFNGSLDDVRIYNRALSAGEISQLYAFSAPDYYSFSTSTDFRMVGAGGESAVGTSTSSSFGLLGGYINNIYRSPTPAYKQIHYHWRNDDGSETTATSMTGGSQDTSASVAKLSTDRVRVEVSNSGGTKLAFSPQQFRLEYGLLSTSCSAITSWTDVGAVGGDWDMSNTANLTDGGNTTNIAVSAGGVSDENHAFLASNGGVKDASSQTSSVSVPSDSFIELEYAIQALSAATDGATYCFRVTNAGATSSMTYTVYPQATISSGTSLTFTTDAGSESFQTVTPAVTSATSSLLSVTTNNSHGFNITLQRSDSTGTMSFGSTYIPDKTAWSAPGATTTAGNATASTTEPQTLQFRVGQSGTDAPNYASSWWGTSDNNSLFAGLPSTAQTIVNRSTPAVSGTNVKVSYSLTVPVTQKNGSYSGSITYTATANP